MIARYRRLYAAQGARFASVALTPRMGDAHVSQQLRRTSSAPICTVSAVADNSIGGELNEALIDASEAGVAATRSTQQICIAPSNLRRRSMPRDGSCLFRSAAVQDGSYGYSAHKRLRCDAIAYVLSRRAHFREFFATVDQDAVPWPNFHDASHPSYLSLTEQCTVASIDRWLARPSAWSVHRFLSLVFRFPR